MRALAKSLDLSISETIRTALDLLDAAQPKKRGDR